VLPVVFHREAGLRDAIFMQPIRPVRYPLVYRGGQFGEYNDARVIEFSMNQFCEESDDVALKVGGLKGLQADGNFPRKKRLSLLQESTKNG
jgi:hypothetical protein